MSKRTNTYSYTYDSSNDTYLLSKRGPQGCVDETVSGDMLRTVLKKYSDGKTAGEIWPGRAAMVQFIVKCTGYTHSSPPWTREMQVSTSNGELVAAFADLTVYSDKEKITRAVMTKLKKQAAIGQSAANLTDFITSRLQKANLPQPMVTRLNSDSSGGYTLILGLSDFHYGKYAPGVYTREIAEQRILSGYLELIERVSYYRGRPSEIVVLIGGDACHIDNLNGHTTAGTPQDCEGNPDEIIAGFVDLMVRLCKMVRDVAPMRLVYNPGNHDSLVSLTTFKGLEHLYTRDSLTRFEFNSQGRSYFTIGNTLVGFCHGNNLKPAYRPATFADECPELWAGTKFRYQFSGHLHTEDMRTSNSGSIVDIKMPSPCPSDRWHKSKGYNSKATQAIAAYVVTMGGGLEDVLFKRF